MKVLFLLICKRFLMNWIVSWLICRRICFFLLQMKKNFFNRIKIYSMKEVFMSHFSFIVIMDE